jgi:hypothetical protein
MNTPRCCIVCTMAVLLGNKMPLLVCDVGTAFCEQEFSFGCVLIKVVVN